MHQPGLHQRSTCQRGINGQLGEQLLEVRGQFDGRGLMDRAHRAAPDEFGRLGGLADETRTALYGR